MTSSLRIKNLKIDKFDYFSSDIDYNSKTDVFILHLIVNQCMPRRPKGASGEHSVSSRTAQAIDARLYTLKHVHIYTNTTRTKVFYHHENLQSNSINVALLILACHRNVLRHFRFKPFSMGKP